MNYDEFAFLNQQLAGMLKSGIPLEGALAQLCSSLRDGALRGELELLRADLVAGKPLRDALPGRKLPELYTRMVLVGAEGNSLPGMLTLLGDYYSQRNALWTRMKGLMVYPAIVLVASLCLSLLFLSLYDQLHAAIFETLFDGRALPAAYPGILWLPICWLSASAVLFAMAVSIPSWRNWLRWRLPGFKESSLAQFASTMRLLLASGGRLREAVALLQTIEKGTELGTELDLWQQRLAAGNARIHDFAGGSRILPALFIWMVEQSGEDLAAGFKRATELYCERARYRVEMLLYAALPVAVLCLGSMIFFQLFIVLRLITGGLDSLGDGSGLSGE